MSFEHHGFFEGSPGRLIDILMVRGALHNGSPPSAIPDAVFTEFGVTMDPMGDPQVESQRLLEAIGDR